MFRKGSKTKASREERLERLRKKAEEEEAKEEPEAKVVVKRDKQTKRRLMLMGFVGEDDEYRKEEIRQFLDKLGSGEIDVDDPKTMNATKSDTPKRKVSIRDLRETWTDGFHKRNETLAEVDPSGGATTDDTDSDHKESSHRKSKKKKKDKKNRSGKQVVPELLPESSTHKNRARAASDDGSSKFGKSSQSETDTGSEKKKSKRESTAGKSKRSRSKPRDNDAAKSPTKGGSRRTSEVARGKSPRREKSPKRKPKAKTLETSEHAPSEKPDKKKKRSKKSGGSDSDRRGRSSRRASISNNGVMESKDKEQTQPKVGLLRTRRASLASVSELKAEELGADSKPMRKRFGKENSAALLTSGPPTRRSSLSAPGRTPSLTQTGIAPASQGLTRRMSARSRSRRRLMMEAAAAGGSSARDVSRSASRADLERTNSVKNVFKF